MDKIFDYCYARGLRANHITLSRLFFAVFVVILRVLGLQTSAFITIAVMWYTDRLDGAFARGRDETLLGRLLDRFIDKIVFVFIIVSAYILLLLILPAIVSFLQYPLYFIVVVVCFFEVWGILLVVYQYKYERDSINNGAGPVGKFKLVAEVVFSMILFCPDSLVDLVLYILPFIFIDQLLIFRSVFLVCYGSVAAFLSYYSFNQHASHLSNEHYFYKLSLPIMGMIVVAIVISSFSFL